MKDRLQRPGRGVNVLQTPQHVSVAKRDIPHRQRKPRCATQMDVAFIGTDAFCEGRFDFSGLEKSNPIRSVSRRALSKLTGRRSMLTSCPAPLRTKRSGNADSIACVTLMLEIGRSVV